jgi:hypothetical protein
LESWLERRVEAWTTSGLQVETLVVADRRGWWFVPDEWQPQEADQSTRQTADAITAWALSSQRAAT